MVIFYHEGHDINKLDRGHFGENRDATYQIARLRQDFFLKFSFIKSFFFRSVNLVMQLTETI